MIDKSTNILSPFFYFNAASFFGSLNDSLYKYLLLYSLLDLEGLKNGPAILSLCGGIFVFPYILFSIPAGVLADKYSKRNIILITKLIEVFTVMILLVSFLIESDFLGYFGLFLLGAEEAFSSPSKYGIVPELVSKDKITLSNGYMTSFSYFGIMLGAVVSSVLAQITNHNYVLASLSLLVIGLLGLISIWMVPQTPAQGSTKKINPFFIRDVMHTLRQASLTEYLLPCMLGVTFFLFIASFSQANIIPYSIYNLGITDVESGYLVFVTTVGVCIGSIAAGKISGPRVALGLIPVGLFGISLCFWLFLATVQHLYLSIANTLLIGIFSGLYLVPQDSYVQAASGNNVRGQNVAAANFLGWCAVFFASFIYYCLRHIIGLSASQDFGVLGLLSFIVAVVAVVIFSFPLLRLTCKTFAMSFLKETKGQELVPKSGTGLFYASEWKAGLFFLSWRERIVKLSASSSKSGFKHSFYSFMGIVQPAELDAILQQKKLVCYVASSHPEDESLNRQIYDRAEYLVECRENVLTISLKQI